MKHHFKCECGKRKTKNFPLGKRKKVKCICGKEMKKEISYPMGIQFIGDGFTLSK